MLLERLDRIEEEARGALAEAGTKDDLEAVERAGSGRVDLTIGSALDIFGGSSVRYAEVVEFNRRPRA